MKKIVNLAQTHSLVVCHLSWVGKVLQNSVQKRLHSLVLESRPHEHWHELSSDCLSPDGGLQSLHIDLLLHDEQLRHFIVTIS